MRISELSDRTGVTIPTLKYYLREGLLHAGEAQSATRAVYDDSHVERVRLVRTLIDVGRLSIERVREVVDALEHPPPSRHQLLGVVHEALRPHPAPEPPTTEAVDRVRALGAPGCDESLASTQLAQALSAAAAGGWVVEDATLRVWQRAMHAVAETDVAEELGSIAPADALRHAIVGTVLTDPVLLALRRVAQEALSAERFGSADPEDGVT
ncbi:MerR family transcriptional regulator [Terrabacter sp. MAHUQ-38]|uniref:MerR family transcriptional regulator n=1 Tax=unclassified Terrabacter TaxID=2630222 RepID=UPI00165DAED7|nr:MerR family transcriptional regulator [Terrabacter sp. MAHUQ-38]